MSASRTLVAGLADHGSQISKLVMEHVGTSLRCQQVSDAVGSADVIGRLGRSAKSCRPTRRDESVHRGRRYAHVVSRTMRPRVANAAARDQVLSIFAGVASERFPRKGVAYLDLQQRRGREQRPRLKALDSDGQNGPRRSKWSFADSVSRSTARVPASRFSTCRCRRCTRADPTAASDGAGRHASQTTTLVAVSQSRLIYQGSPPVGRLDAEVPREGGCACRLRQAVDR